MKSHYALIISLIYAMGGMIGNGYSGLASSILGVIWIIFTGLLLFQEKKEKQQDGDA